MLDRLLKNSNPLPDGRWGTVPSSVTLLGGCITVYGLSAKAPWALVVGILCDVLDGWLARRLKVESDVGARLDWSLDVMLMGGMVAMLDPLYLLNGIGIVAMALFLGIRASGRALASALLILSWH